MNSKVPSDILTDIFKIMNSSITSKRLFPPTDLFNESWMLRLALQYHMDGGKCLPFPIYDNSSWYSEALIPSKFLLRYRGDPLAESWTPIDGVVGHFESHGDTKLGISLTREATQLIIIEAKMFSNLSTGTKNARHFNQASRIVACIGAMIDNSKKSLDDLKSLGFYVFAPKEMINRHHFNDKISKKKIAEEICQRVDGYKGQKGHGDLVKWYNEVMIALIERIDIQPISWEEILLKMIENVQEKDLLTVKRIAEFYYLCLSFNQKSKNEIQYPFKDKL